MTRLPFTTLVPDFAGVITRVNQTSCHTCQSTQFSVPHYDKKYFVVVL